MKTESVLSDHAVLSEDLPPALPDSLQLLRVFQTWLGASREQCDDGGKRLWDRIEAALKAHSDEGGRTRKAARLVEEFYNGTAERDWPAWGDEAVGELEGL